MTDKHGYFQTHPEYDAAVASYILNADLYDGGAAMESPSKARKYLSRHPLERNRQYDVRVRRAAYRNYAAPTVDLFASSVMNGASRNGLESVPEFAPMLEDCDRLGNTPDKFFKRVDTLAAAVGAAFVLVDMPRADGGALTRKDAGDQGLVPYFVLKPARNIIAWDYGEDGSLAWAVERSTAMRATNGPFSAYRAVTAVTLWQKEGWTRFESVDGKEFVPAGEGENPANVVPLVPFLYEPVTPMTGRGVIDDVASLIMRVYNQDSEMDKMLFDAALPILAVFGLEESESEALEKSTSVLWRFGSPEARLQYVEPAGAAFSAKRRQIQDDIESIREISLRQTKPRGAGVESAEARRLDAVQISSQLAEFARSAAACEKRCWTIVAKMAGVDPDAMKRIRIAYNETFDPESLREKLTETFLELRRNGDLSRETLLTRLGFSEEEIAEEQARLAAERRETA